MKILQQYVLIMLMLSGLAGSVFAQGSLLESGNANKIALKNCTAVNTSALEFSPTFYQSGLVFVSSRRKNGRMDNKIGETFFELYFSALDGNGLPIDPEEFSLELNSQLHEGPVSFSKDGNLVYFTTNNQQNGASKTDAKGKVRLKIYEAQRGSKDWEKVKELPFNSDEYSCAHPTLSADGTKLYFASDMPGGLGGMDLYVSEKKNDVWSFPKNLGAGINTAKNEVFPFIHKSGMLFFSSNGRGGAGDLDVFKVNTNSSDEPQNLGEPVNSTKDDLGLIVNSDGMKGYLSSNRSGGAGKDDLYEFEVSTNGVGGEAVAATNSTLFKVRDAQTLANLEGAEIRVFKASKEGLLGSNDLYDVVLMPAAEGGKEMSIKLIRKDINSLNKPDRYADARGEARYDMQSNSKYLILISKEGYETEELAYTANNTKEALVVPMRKKNCAVLRVLVRNQATTVPLSEVLVRATNSCDDEMQTLFTDSNGEVKMCLQVGCNYTLNAEKVGFKNSNTKIKSVTKEDISKLLNVSIEMGTGISKPAPPSPTVAKTTNEVRAGSTMVLENIYYDFNQYIIRPDAAVELDALGRLLQQNPSMEIELRSHTDSRGSSGSNMSLSEKRARQARQYLVNQGIRAERIKAIGMGETEPRNRCKDGVECSEEEYQYNRRTEVKVLKMDNSIQVEYQNSPPRVVGGKN